mmetsp:Transcript_8166/g.15391  ORF Transcript_8166/g.15391 Transcript_8166/m.15391 type:complete len:220 (+) Transcript_8166:568-1227(+)
MCICKFRQFNVPFADHGVTVHLATQREILFHERGKVARAPLAKGRDSRVSERADLFHAVHQTLLTLAPTFLHSAMHFAAVTSHHRVPCKVHCRQKAGVEGCVVAMPLFVDEFCGEVHVDQPTEHLNNPILQSCVDPELGSLDVKDFLGKSVLRQPKISQGQSIEPHEALERGANNSRRPRKPHHARDGGGVGHGEVALHFHLLLPTQLQELTARGLEKT